MQLWAPTEVRRAVRMVITMLPIRRSRFFVDGFMRKSEKLKG